MRRWEDLRATTGVLDRINEIGLDVDAVREDANCAYDEADGAFGRAKDTEQRARQDCLARLKAAGDALPDFRGGNFADAVS